MHWVFLAALVSQAPESERMPPSADELVKKLDATPELKEKDKPFEISVSLARLYFGQGRYKEAASFYEQALKKAAPIRMLYEQLRKVPEGAVSGCEVQPAHDLAFLLKQALEKQKTKDLATAAACVRAAAQAVAEAEVQLGHSWFLGGDQAAALDVYSKTIATFEKNADARYSRGALLLDWKGDEVASLAIAKADFERFLKDVPASPKAREAKVFLERTTAALAAGGVSKLAPRAAPMAALGQPPVLTKEMMEAFQNTPRTAQMQDKFAKTLDEAEVALAQGQFQAALDGYKQVMPYQPENPRVRAGMAWSLVKLGKPMAERVWGVATQSPDAIVALGDALKKQGNEVEAKAVWARLAESVPSYAGKVQGR